MPNRHSKFMANTAAAGAAGGDVVTVSGRATLFAFAFMSEARAEIIFDDDGTTDERVNGGARVQFNASTDWIIPNGSAPGLYQTRYTNLTVDPLDGATSAAEDTWRAFTLGDFFFVQTDNSPSAGGQNSNFDIQVRLSTGSPLDTGAYSLDADREDF